jgi:voltage-gated potassium channel
VDDPGPNRARPSAIDRSVARISNARSVTVGLALTFVAMAVIGAVVIRLVDTENFPSFGLAVWWALQTVTTVGYGDVTPTTVAGRVIGGLEMVIGVSFIAFLTAGVTSTVITRSATAALEDERSDRERQTRAIVEALAETTSAIADLDRRLEQIESKLPG